MWLQYIFQNIHFALNVTAALILFAAFWLYFDASIGLKSLRERFRSIGFLMISISYLMHAGYLESPILTNTISTSVWYGTIYNFLHLGGYLFLIASLIFEPLMQVPKTIGIVKKNNPANPVSALTAVSSISLIQLIPALLYPLSAFLIAGLYFRRAYIGLERHIKKIGIAFVFLGFSDLLSVGELFRGSASVTVSQLVAPFGPVWIAQHLVLGVFLFILGRWVLGYLLLRFDTQFFMILTGAVTVIFLIATAMLTGTLINNLAGVTQKRLLTGALVLNYAIDTKKSEVLSQAESVAASPDVAEYIFTGNRQALADLTGKTLLMHKQSSLVITDPEGKVLARGEDQLSYGGTEADVNLLKRAIGGEKIATVIAKPGVLAPMVLVEALVPVKRSGSVIGIVIEQSSLDDAFLEGMKKSTGLEVSLYSQNFLTATTNLLADKVTRPIGTKLDLNHVKKIQTGSIQLYGQPYFVAEVPLFDMDNNIPGVLLTGEPQSVSLSGVGSSIEWSFWIMIWLISFSFPLSLSISKSIANQVKE
jgi:hypothetical protein